MPNNVGGFKIIENLRNGMIYRCHNPKSVAYKRYGAVNIFVCKQWIASKNNFYN